MQKFISETGHALAALSLSALGLGLAATQSGAIGGKAGMVILGAGILYQAFTGKALQIQAPTPVAPVAPVAAAAPVVQASTVTITPTVA